MTLNGPEIGTYFILCIRCNSITSVWGGNPPPCQKMFFFFFLFQPYWSTHSFLLTTRTIFLLWTFHYGCPMCNNRDIIILQVRRQFGFYLFYVRWCLQIVLPVLLRLASKPGGCSTGRISVLEAVIPPLLTTKHTQHAPCEGLPLCRNLISFIIHGSC